MKNKVTMVGLASGIVLGTLGYTHCSIEDVSIMRSIPNITIISPADCSEVYKAAFALLKYDKPVMVDFRAEWCGTSRMLGPNIE